MKTHAAMRLLILLCLGRALAVIRTDVADDRGEFGRKSYVLSTKHNPNDGDDNMIRRIEEEMLALNKSGELPRDKRALGILLQGFMEALGYTVAPIQIGSLANPMAAAQMMPPAAAAPAPPAGMMPPRPPMMANASAPPPPRQRETLRFTGILNFGNNVNTSNVVSHLAQYEQMFHGGNRTAPQAAAGPPRAPGPAPAPAPSIDPRSQAPLPEPLFVKIPLPIVPNLPPPQPPSPMPIHNTYHEEYTKDHDEEYQGGKEDADQHGNYEEEKEGYRHNEEYENKHENYDESENKEKDDESENKEKYDESENKEKDDESENREKDDESENKEKDDETEQKPEKPDEPEDRNYEHSYERYDEPEDRNYEYKGSEGSREKPGRDPEAPPPPEKNSEKEYKKNENVVNYSVERKEIHDPSEVSEEVPTMGSKFNHAMYVGEPNWKKQHDDHVYKLAAEQEAQVEALAEENAEREKDRSREHELDEETKEFHRNREKEISDRNEEHAESYEDNNPKDKPSYDDEESHEEPEKESYSDHPHYNNDNEDDYEEETKLSERPPSDSQHKEASTEVPTEKPKATEKTEVRKYKDYPEDDDRKSGRQKNYDSDDEEEEQEKPHKYSTSLPISYDREKARQDGTLRDSYGENLEKPGGKVDERVAGYFTMFKNPQTGVFDPTIIQQYENSRGPYDTGELVDGFKKIQKEYGRPESKYEEYEISNEDEDDRAEHRGESNSRRPPSEDYHEQEKSEIESKKTSKKVHPERLTTTTECDCSKETKRPDVHSEEARSPGKTVTTGLPPTARTAEVPVSYGPYYSTVDHLYQPLDYDQGIIARLTSYSPPTTTRFNTRTDLIHNPSLANAQLQRQQQTYLTTEQTATLPERLTTQSLLREVEAKEIRAWPAPFDYVYDNSEHSDVVHRGTQLPIVESTTNNRPTTHQTPFELTKPKPPNCYHEAHTLPPGRDAAKVQKMLRDTSNNRYDLPISSQPTRRRDSRRGGRRAKPTGEPTLRADHYLPLPTTQATILEQRKRPSSSTERVSKHHERNRAPTYSPTVLETLAPYPAIARTLKAPALNGASRVRRPDEGNRQASRAKPTAKQKHEDYPPLRGRKAKDESTNYVEKDGMLIIPEPTPYYYSERLEEFTEGTPSNTEQIKIKEYRNRIASVKVSELKQLHPEGSMQIVKYTRHL